MIEAFNPVLIYYQDVDLNELGIISEIKSHEHSIDKLYCPNQWNDNVFSTLQKVPNIVTQFKMRKLYNFLHTHLLNYFSEIDFYPLNFHLVDSWFNKTYKYGFQDSHIHGKNMVSGCLYYEENLQKEEGIEFNCDKYSSLNMSKFITYDYKFGRIILFPGDLVHKVRYKKNEGVRKSFSFNFLYEI